MGECRGREGGNFWRAGEVGARKTRKSPDEHRVSEVRRREMTGLRSKRKVKFQEEQSRENHKEDAREGERPRSEWKPDQGADFPLQLRCFQEFHFWMRPSVQSTSSRNCRHEECEIIPACTHKAYKKKMVMQYISL